MASRGSNWDEVQLDSVSTPPNLEDLSSQEAIDAIKEWFFENFEDPAEITPFESREGGYQYIWGGPYDAADVVGDMFADVTSEEVIDAAVAAIQEDGIWEWAPNNRRIQPPEEEEPFPPSADSKVLHSNMLEKLNALERAMGDIPELAPGIGHNQPPEPIEALPITEDDRRVIVTSIDLLKEQPVAPDGDLSGAEEAAKSLRFLGEKVSSYLAEKADTFVTEAVKSAGSETGKWGARLAIWGLLAKLLAEAGQAALDWIHSLGSLF